MGSPLWGEKFPQANVILPNQNHGTESYPSSGAPGRVASLPSVSESLVGCHRSDRCMLVEFTSSNRG